MAIRAAVGHAQALDSREAAAQATRRALEQAGREPVALAVVFASHHYPIQMVANGIASVLSDVPIFGFSTLGEFGDLGTRQRSIVVALLCGDIQARADWWPGYAEDSHAVAQTMSQAFQLGRTNGVLFLAVDGINGDATQLCDGLLPGKYALFGSLAGGDVSLRRTYQVGGRKSGVNGLGAALVTGERLATAIGYGHGWVAMENYLPVTRSDGLWLKSLEQHSPAEHYAHLFGFSADEWRTPPLSRLVRLYPLGLRTDDGQPPLVRSPLCVETVDGSLQMHSNLPVGSQVCLMVGSSQACIQAAEAAGQQALKELGTAKPFLALVLVDVAWQMLMEAQPGAEILALRRVLGEDIPIIGGYTFGAVTQSQQSTDFLNQHLVVLLLAEA